jgi:putative acetyltransferase
MTCEPPAFFAGLAPVAVSPAEQSRGVGAALCRAGIEAVRALGADAVVVLGHPAYYPRFGFSAEAAKPLASPYAGSPAFMALALKPGALASTRRVDYPAAFG